MCLEPQLFVFVLIEDATEDEKDVVNLPLHGLCQDHAIDIFLGIFQEAFNVGVVECQNCLKDGTDEFVDSLENAKCEIFAKLLNLLHELPLISLLIVYKVIVLHCERLCEGD